MTFRLIILVILALPLPSFAAYQITKTPNWVQLQPLPETNLLVEDYAVRYRLVDRQRKLDLDGTWTSYHHYGEQPLNQDGLVDIGKVEILYRPSYQQLNLHFLQVIRDGQIIDKLNTARIEEINVEPDNDAEQISQMKQLLIIVDDLKLGDQLEYGFSKVGRNPVFGDKVSTSFQLGWSVPVDAVFSRLVMPNNQTINFQLQNTDQSPVVTKGMAFTDYTWQKKDITPIFPDDAMPEDISIYPALHYTQYDAWPEVANWANALFSIPNTVEHPNWSKWLFALQALPDKEQQVVEALKLVQNEIRYVGIEVGENSHRPHPPAETLELGYGDCKDKSLLLVSLLKALNIDAVPALVHTENGASILSLPPTPKLFDHVITRVNIGGTSYWLDPTKSFQEGSKLSDIGYDSYDIALPVEQDAELEKMPWSTSNRALVQVHEIYRTYGYDVPVKLEVESTYTGAEADYKRRQLKNSGLREISQDYLNYYDRIYKGAEIIDSLSYQDDRQNNQIRVLESYWLDGFWQWSEQDDRYEYQIEASSFGDYFNSPKQLKRQYPWGKRKPKHIVQKVDIFYPETLKRAQFKPMEKLFEDQYIRFNVRNQELGHVTRYQFDYLNYKDRVEALDIRDHTDLLAQARSHLTYSGWVKTSTNHQDRSFHDWFESLEAIE